MGHAYEQCRRSTLDYEMTLRDYVLDQEYFDLAVLASSRCKTKISVIEFLLDSGASDHMVNCIDWLRDVQEIEPRSIMLGNGMKVYGTHRGTLVLRTMIGSGDDTYERDVLLRKVLFVPDLRSNLISCSMLCSDGYTINFNSKRCVGLKEGVIQFQGGKRNGVYRVNCVPISSQASCAHIARHSPDHDEDIGLWHARLGHAHPERIRKLLRAGAVTGISVKPGSSADNSCGACMRGKQAKETLRPNKSRSKRKCAVIHADVCGPMSVPSFSGARYFVIFVDEYSGHKTVIPIALKSDVRAQFIWYHAWIERKFDCSIKRLHSDNGGEFVALAGYLREQGIEHTMSPSYSPNLNGTAERANRSVVESARSMLEHSGLQKRFWAEAVTYAAKIQNRFLSPRDQTKTTYELMAGQKPSVKHFKVFGCMAWRHIPKDLRKKLDAKSEMGIVINCLDNSQYKLWIPSRRVVVVSRDVRIVEDQFPARSLKDDAVEGLIDVLPERVARTPAQSGTPPVMTTPTPPSATQADQPSENKSVPVANEAPQEFLPTETQQDYVTHYPDTDLVETPSDDLEQGVEDEHEDGQSESRYPRRSRKTPSYYVPGSANTAVRTEHSTGMLDEPSTVPEALRMYDAEQWKEAIESELGSLRKHGTWEVVDRHDGMKLLSARFVFLRKYDENGRVIRHKARLVVKGYMQGNVDTTFAPVVDFSSVRTAVAVAVQRGYILHQMDVRTAFLHGEIDDVVHVTAPEGVKLCKPDQVLKLRRGLYGLKQAPRLWHEKWLSVMDELGFRKLFSDPCIFRRGTLWLLLYVDDIILMSPQASKIVTVKQQLAKRLDVKDLGVLRSFLGVMLVYEGRNVWLSQEHYVRNVLRRFRMEACKPVSTPMGTAALKEAENCPAVKVDKQQFQELLGSLLFLSTRTRPDVSAAVAILCRYTSEPMRIHWTQLKRVLRYLKGTMNYGLRFSPNDGRLVAFCDADWAGDRSDRKSTTGFMLRLGSTTIMWQTTKQKSVALSTTEAEFCAMSEASKMVIWMRKLLEELDEEQQGSTELMGDNQGALVWGNDGIRHAKHVSIRLNFVKECIDRGIIGLSYCSTSEMIADVLTKPLLRLAFAKYREALGVLPVQVLENAE